MDINHTLLCHHFAGPTRFDCSARSYLHNSDVCFRSDLVIGKIRKAICRKDVTLDAISRTQVCGGGGRPWGGECLLQAPGLSGFFTVIDWTLLVK